MQPLLRLWPLVVVPTSRSNAVLVLQLFITCMTVIATVPLCIFIVFSAFLVFFFFLFFFFLFFVFFFFMPTKSYVS